VDDIELNKRAIVARCIERIEQEYGDDPDVLEKDLTKQDSVVLNIQRACEAVIDLANHRVRKHRLGIPQESRDAFQLLERSGRLPGELSTRLQRMVGFRNVAIHDYQKLNLAIVRAIVEQHLDDLVKFTELELEEPD
jgi:uncharacterized protein YutE (UPF0331/DUF86 family)